MVFLALAWSFISITLVAALPISVFLASSTIHGGAFLRSIQTYLVALAIGCLLGDAIYHLIPEALGAEMSTWRTSMILAGIFVYLWGERVLQQYHRGHGHEHLENHELGRDADNLSFPRHLGILLVSTDIMHSFVDGIAIGVSYQSSLTIGLSTTIAVLFHEVPHLLGDFAVLLSAGYSKLQICQYSVAAITASFTGSIIIVVIGVLLGNPSTVLAFRQNVLAFCAGNFLYISLADLVPELLNRRIDHWYQNSTSSWASILQYLSIIVGMGIMFLVKMYFE